MKSTFSGHALAAADAPATTVKIAGVRSAITDLVKLANDLGGVLNEGPVKAKCLEIVGNMNQALAGLPADDAKPEAIKPDEVIASLLSVVASSNSVLTQARAGMMDEMQASVERAIAKKISAGELHTHADLAAKVDAAKHETHAGMMEHMKCYASRRQAMASAKIPIPIDDVVMLAEEQFTPRLALATDRCKQLEPFGLGEDRLRVLAWNADAETFKTVFDTLTERPLVKEEKKAPASVFENSKANEAAKDRTRFIGAGL